MAGSTEITLDTCLSRFGLRQFRPGQREVIEAVLAGEDCLCIMPTGGGKSLCYQLPAVMRPGVTLVVSPLIALMKDQVDQLRRLGIRAGLVNSSLSLQEQSERLSQLAQGQLDLLYVAPERLRNPRFFEALRQTKVQLLAIDEAHCISEWGHDFRHDYTRLGQYRRRMGNPQTIALTATATRDVRQDVIQQLELKNPKTFVAGFARPNLIYEVQAVHPREKMLALLPFLSEVPGPGIIYASTRKGTEEIAETLEEAVPRKVLVYHAGLATDERRRVQDEFMSGMAEIVVATNAFGMGINKPDVRFVVHYNIPGSVEAYYQEAGRAGRDGKPSRCLLLYSASDRRVQEFFIENNYPPEDTIKATYEFLCARTDDPIELTQEQIRAQLGLSTGAEGIGTCERLLEKCGILERLEPNRNMAIARIDTEVPTLQDLLPRQAQTQRAVAQALERIVGTRRYETVYFHPQQIASMTGLSLPAALRALRELTRLESVDYVPPFRGRAIRMLRRDLKFEQLELDLEELDLRRQANLDRLERMIQYARSRTCRQLDIMQYFGETSAQPCGQCDNCTAHGTVTPRPAATAASPAVHEAVLKILSGVARAKGRFGKQVIAAMLVGSRSAKVQKWGLDQLSTFGILGHLTQADLMHLIDILIQDGLLQQLPIDRYRTIVTLTDYGTEVMRGKQKLSRCPAFPAAVVQKLESDATSIEPDRDTPSCRPTAAGPQLASTGPWPEYYWTWRLLHDGYSWSECLAARGLDTEGALAHLLRALDEGYPVRPEWVFDQEQLDQLSAGAVDERRTSVDSLLAKLQGRYNRQQLELFLKCRASGPGGSQVAQGQDIMTKTAWPAGSN